MADQSAKATPAAPNGRSAASTAGFGSLPVVTTAGGLFCVALVFLALQMRAGEDPAIGAGGAEPAAQPRPVIVRRVIVRRIVEGPAAAHAPGVPSAPAASAAPAAPAAAAAPASAPAPAPAPATTQAS